VLVTSPPETLQSSSGLRNSILYDSDESKLDKEWSSLSFSRSPSLSLSKSASLSHSPEQSSSSPWPCLILNEYQIYKSSSSSNTPAVSTSTSTSSSNSSSLASTIKSVNLTSALRKSQEEANVDNENDFPSRLSDCKEYVDTDIVDMLSPAFESIEKNKIKSSSISNQSKSNQGENEVNNDDDDEEGTRKLFIGRVPKCLTADDLLQFF